MEIIAAIFRFIDRDWWLFDPQFFLSMNLYQLLLLIFIFNLCYTVVWQISYSFPEALAKPVFMIYVITHHVNIGRPTVKWIKAHLQSVYLCVSVIILNLLEKSENLSIWYESERCQLL